MAGDNLKDDVDYAMAYFRDIWWRFCMHVGLYHRNQYCVEQ